jgi:hypothetical protein
MCKRKHLRRPQKPSQNLERDHKRLEQSGQVGIVADTLHATDMQEMLNSGILCRTVRLAKSAPGALH